MSLFPRVLAAGGLLAVPALLAVGSQVLSRPAEVPLQERQTVVVDLAPAGTTDTAPVEDGTQPTGPGPASPAWPSPSPASPVQTPEPNTEPSPEMSRPAPVPVVPAPANPAPVNPAPAPPADQGTPGLVERQMLGDTDDDTNDDEDYGPDIDDDTDDED